jgi:DNA polymerase III alpha subunit (gram-positive type)
MSTWKDWPIAFLDTETTGIGAEGRIVEMSVAIFEYRKFSIQISAVFNPGEIDWENPDVAEAMKINGIDRGLLEVAKTFRELWPAFVQQLDRSHIICGQFVQYDLWMIEKELKRVNQINAAVDRITLDTITLDWGIHPNQESYKLAEIAKRWDVEMPQAHRAAGDVETCSKILFKMMDQLPDGPVELLQRHDKWSDERKLWREKRVLDRKKSPKEGS